MQKEQERGTRWEGNVEQRKIDCGNTNIHSFLISVKQSGE